MNIAPCLLSCYTYPMTITQTVEIPANRRLTINIPSEVPAGKAQLEVKVIPFAQKEEKPKDAMRLLALRGSCKGLDTMDAYFARKRVNKAFEDGLTNDNPYEIRGQ